MENLPITWDEIKQQLGHPSLPSRTIPGFRIADAPPKRMGMQFFKIRYALGEVIMPEGVYSDFTGVHLQGRVRVFRRTTASHTTRPGPEECWNRPGLLLHRFENWILDHTDRMAPPDKEPLPWHKQGMRWLRGRLQRLEDWVLDRTDRLEETKARELSWLQRRRRTLVGRFGRWLRRRFRERALAKPVPLGAAAPEGFEELCPPKSTVDAQGNELPLLHRFMGVAGTLWNLPRSATLVAQPDDAGNPCEFLLIKREVLLKIYELSEQFRAETDRRFLNEQLADVLAENRFFRNTFYETDVTDWPGLLARLKGGRQVQLSAGSRRVVELLEVDFRRRLAGVAIDNPDDRVRYWVLGQLNTLLKDQALYTATAWPMPLGEEAESFRKRAGSLTENETIRFNRILVEAALADVMKTSAPFHPLQTDEFRELIDDVQQATGLQGITLLHYQKGDKICQEGDDSRGLHLIVSGTVRVTKRMPGGEMLLNQLERHGYLGVSIIEEGAKHSATTQAVTDVNAVFLSRAAIRAIVDRYPAVGEKLRAEKSRLKHRDKHLESIDRLPPADPPEAIASKLLIATDLLRIDMDLCTRCDQCVRACAEAHDGVTRFQRANPALRFGKWEVAAACVHCSDAPCQNACPVGAITFLDSGAVQIHRNRCIGCKECVPACPFDVIEMRPPSTLLDIAKENKAGLVALKCDLCLSDRDPPCVASCPYGAAERGTPRKLFPGIKSWADDLAAR